MDGNNILNFSKKRYITLKQAKTKHQSECRPPKVQVMAILTKLINQVTNTSKSPLQHFAKVDYCKVELSSPANFDEILKRFLDYLLWAPYFGLTKFTTFNYRVFSHVKEHFLSHSHHWCSLKTAFTNPFAYYS